MQQLCRFSAFRCVYAVPILLFVCVSAGRSLTNSLPQRRSSHRCGAQSTCNAPPAAGAANRPACCTLLEPPPAPAVRCRPKGSSRRGRACEHSGVSWRVSAPGRPWPAEVLQLVTPEREYLLAVGDTAILLPPLSTFKRCFNG